jgi:hypothetical protein
MKNERNDPSLASFQAISALISRYRASGLGLARFARQQGIAPGQLHYWIYQKGRTPSRKSIRPERPAPVFQEVQVTAVMPGISGWAAEVSLPQGGTVRFSGTAAPGWIGLVVQALQRPC